MSKAVLRSERRTGLGAERQCDIRAGGWFRERVTVWQPARELEFTLYECTLPVRRLRHHYTLTPEHGGTRVDQTQEYTLESRRSMRSSNASVRRPPCASAAPSRSARTPADGLELIARADIDAQSYPYVHLVRGALLADAGETEEALSALHEAARHARNEPERRQIEERIARLRPSIECREGRAPEQRE